MGAADVQRAAWVVAAGVACASAYLILLRRRRRTQLAIRMTQPGVECILFGASPLAGFTYAPCDEERATAAVHKALDLGIRKFDTAPHYGLGLSEQRLGSALESHPQGGKAQIWTKVGRYILPRTECDVLIANGSINRGDVEWDNMHGSPECIFPSTDPALAEVADYSAKAALRSHNASVRRLRREHVPLKARVLAGQRVHDPDTDARCSTALAADGAVAEIVRLRSRGVIGEVSIGCWSVKHTRRMLRTTPIGTFDSIMLAGRWNLLDQSGYDLLLECQRLGVKVHNASVFASGLLVGGSTYQNKAAPPDIQAKAARWESLARRYGSTLPVVALHFALLPEVVDLVALGMRDAEEVEANVTHLACRLDPRIWADAQSEGLLPASLRLASIG